MSLISFIVPVYNEAGNIELLFRRLLDEVVDTPRFAHDAEFVFVDDGSSDASLVKLMFLAETDSRIKVVELSRNFGHQMAVTAGLDTATGDAVIIMDADLQDPPATCLALIEQWEQGFEVVNAKRRSRTDSAFKKATANLYYRFLSWAAEVHIERDTGDFRLIDRKVVDVVKRFPERSRFLRGLIGWVGFKQTVVLFDRDGRHSGTTNYTLKRMLNLAADGILSFSIFPLKLIRVVGWVVSLLALVGVIYVLIARLFSADLVPGWAFTIISILFVGGIQIVMLSVLGSYIGRIYREAQGRPLYLVREVHTKALGLATAVEAVAPRTITAPIPVQAEPLHHDREGVALRS